MCVYTYLICTHIVCAYIYDIFVYTCSLLLIISEVVTTLSSCWLNLHVAHSSVKPLSHLEPQSFFPTSSSSQPSKALKICQLSISFSPGIVWAIYTSFEKDVCFHWGWGFWVCMMIGPIPGQKAALEALLLLGMIALVAKWVGLHNLLKFLSWNALKS